MDWCRRCGQDLPPGKRHAPVVIAGPSSPKEEPTYGCDEREAILRLKRGGAQMAQKPGFTPGPWDYFGTMNGTGIDIGPAGRDYPSRPIATITTEVTGIGLPGTVHEANARLIAAAPDLLAVVQHALHAPARECDLEALALQAEAALRKAGVF